MVDATQATESEYVTADLINKLAKKQMVIIDAGSYEKTDWGDKLTLKVEIEGGRTKIYRPNKDSAKNLASMYGMQTTSWLGKIIGLSVVSIRGKDCVVALPTHDKVKATGETETETVN